MTNLQYQFFAAIIKFTQTIILQPSNDAHNKSLLAYGSISKQPAFWLSVCATLFSFAAWA
jgi:hypothetical protein